MQADGNGATLIAHCDTNLVSREQLAAIPTPEGTDTFRPVPHIELVMSIEAILETKGIAISREQFAVRADGSRLFATFDLSLEGIAGSCGALGIRTGNDRTMKLQMLTGLRIFVCDNMDFSGDEIILHRKHPSQLDLLPELMGAISRYQVRYSSLLSQVKGLAETTLLDTEAKAIIHDAFLAEIMPLRYLKDVSEAYFHPQIADWEPRTAWVLQNAFTGCMKDMTLNRRMAATQELGKVFGLLEQAA